MLAGRRLGGGIAYLSGLCSPNFGYGVSGNLDYGFDIDNPTSDWDIVVLVHELGHNFGSPHTHCFRGVAGIEEPVDPCWAREPGCWNGAEALPCAPGQGCGTIMSYCHLHSGGMSNVSLTLGEDHPHGAAPWRVPLVMRQGVASAASANPQCLELRTDCIDRDGDGECELTDNCPAVANPGQADGDGDGVGDACDNCPSQAGSDSRDGDGDGVGDACDPCIDPDRDGFGDFPDLPGTCPDDNCPGRNNPTQTDQDGDGAGDTCDPCPAEAGDDGDPICAHLDNCPALANPDQADADADDIGDACDSCTDLDSDGRGDSGYPLNTCLGDNCPALANPTQQDSDGDGLGDVCDICPTVADPGQADGDADGAGDACDNCLLAPNPGQEDPDGDGRGGVCDNCGSLANADQADDDRGNLGPRRTVQQSTGASWIDAADVDGDGDNDLISASYGSDQLAWIENASSDGSLWLPRPLAAVADGPIAVRAGDIDDDGDLDLACVSYFGDRLAWYPNLGAGVFGPPQTISSATDGPQRIELADLDGDLDLDAISVSSGDSEVAWYENTDGRGHFGPQRRVTNAFAAPQAVRAADLDADGDLDLLVAWLLGGGTVGWHENLDGRGTFGDRRVISTPVPFARDALAADLDGDSDLDVISVSFNDDRIAWYANDGAGTFGPRMTISTAVDGPWATAVADLDADGDLDVLSASSFDNSIAWFPNLDGHGTFGGRITITAGAAGARSVAAADLDGDRQPDVASASSNDNLFAWYPNRGDGVGDVCDLCPSVLDAGQPDADADGRGDACDNCPSLSNAEQLDVDRDGAGDACDCYSAGPDDGRIGDALRVDKSVDAAVLSWDAESGPGPFRIYRGWRAPATAWSYNQYCVEEGITETGAVDLLAPPVGRLFYYLVTRHASPGCAEPPLGSDSEGVPILGDSECTSSRRDVDGDGTEEAADTCPGVSDPAQLDTDGDGLGDACDP